MADRIRVKVWTSSQYSDAGTLARVQIQIIGEEDKKTDWLTLNTFLPDVIDVGEVKSYCLEISDVGKPVMIELKLAGSQKNDPWLCQKVEIRRGWKTYTFPVYDWVEETTMAIAKASLPQHVKSDYAKEQRKAELKRNLEAFAWETKPEPGDYSYGLPRHLPAKSPEQLPLILRWSDERKDSFEEANAISVELVTQNITQSENFKLDSLDSYKKIYSGLAKDQPPFIDIWNSDEEFGRQVLNGVSPLVIERCEKLPDYCNINDQNCFLPGNKKLNDEMKAGRIFISDYKPIVEGVPFNIDPTTKKSLFAPEAVALFHSSRRGDFLPIAIQLTPNDPDSVFSPKDTEDDWLLAKMYYKSAKTSAHELKMFPQWIYHFVRTHAVTETVSIAMFRNFSRNHPLYKLLRPHVRTAARINTVGRVTLLPPGSTANFSVALPAVALGPKNFKTFDLSLLDMPQMFEKTGTNDHRLLPTYHYRDDALALWDAIEDYVEDVLSMFYYSDEDVAKDTELQSWCLDLATEGLGWFDGNTRGMPKSIETISELEKLCTMVIFNATAQHAAVNFGQFEIYQFIPNNPGSMRLPPHKKGEANLERILNSLPDLTISSFQNGLSYSLSQYAENEIYIGEFPEQFFTTRRSGKIQKRFSRKLKRLSRKMHRRNRYLEIPYTFLLPEKIPNSVAA